MESVWGFLKGGNAKKDEQEPQNSNRGDSNKQRNQKNKGIP